MKNSQITKADIRLGRSINAATYPYLQSVSHKFYQYLYIHTALIIIIIEVFSSNQTSVKLLPGYHLVEVKISDWWLVQVFTALITYRRAHNNNFTIIYICITATSNVFFFLLRETNRPGRISLCRDFLVSHQMALKCVFNPNNQFVIFQET